MQIPAPVHPGRQLRVGLDTQEIQSPSSRAYLGSKPMDGRPVWLHDFQMKWKYILKLKKKNFFFIRKAE